MLNFAQIETRRAALAALLAELQAGKIECIEYGKPGEHYMSYVRIRHSMTAGGVQFHIHRLTHGIEGSGEYTPDAGEALRMGMDAVIYYHRPASPKIQAALRAKNGKPEADPDDLSFFAVTDESTRTGGRRLLGEDPLAYKDQVVVELTI